MINFQLIVWEVLCVALFYSVFCRAVHMKPSARSDLVLANWLIGIFSIVGVAAPMYGWQPDAMIIFLATSIVLVRLSTARSWSNGVPDAFLKEKFKLKKNRRSNDNMEGRP